MSRPVIVLTMGDPAGIGPEILVRTLQEQSIMERCQPVIVGDPDVIRKAIGLTGSALDVCEITSPGEAGGNPGYIYVIPAGLVSLDEIKSGKADARWGISAAESCRKAVELVQSGHVAAIVSTPFNKEAFHMAKIDAMDDMEYFEQCFGYRNTAYMIGEIAGLWITMVTFHVSFRAVPDLINTKTVLQKIRNLHDVMKSAGISPIKIGVAGLNVHSGEGGMFGREEIDSISPAIDLALKEGYDVVGPIPGDSLFTKALRGEYCGLVCMYHDQANIGRKILGLDKPGVTFYLGMPVPVLTVPHGTAYDIAWQGKANHKLLLRALVMAEKMVCNKERES